MSLQSILNKPAALLNKSLNLWANEVHCNKLFADEIITPVIPTQTKVFKMGMPLGGVIPLLNASISNPCVLDLIPNPDSDILANTYTAPVAEFISVSASVKLVPIAGSGDVRIEITKNGAPVEGLTVWDQVNAGGASAGWSVAVSGLCQLAQGDVLGVLLTFSSFGGGWNWGEFSFSAQVL